MSTTVNRIGALAALLLLAALLAPAPAAAQTASVRPIYECTVDLGEGLYRSYFGYQNDTGVEQVIEVGPGNNFTGGADADLGQPETFGAGDLGGPRANRTPFYPNAAFHVDWNGSGNLVWTLDGRTATANTSSNPCDLTGNVRPILECVADLGEGGHRAFFGYQNDNEVPVSIPVGTDNRFTGGTGPDEGQPVLFEAGELPGDPVREGRTAFYPDAAFSVDFTGGPLVWTLGGRTATAAPTATCDGVDEVSPILECVIVDGSSVQAFFGYENRAGYTVVAPAGGSSPANRTTGPAITAGALPSTFEEFPADAPDGRPNRTPFYPDAAFSLTFDGSAGNLVWLLGDSSATAGLGSRACPVDTTPTTPGTGGGGSTPDPDPDPETPPAQEADPIRLGGGERIETAVVVSQEIFADGEAGAVVLARQDDPADAVTGTPLAASLNAPVLLTEQTQLTAITASEIDRVLPPGGTVVIMGGEAAVADVVEDALVADGYDVQRVEGPNRFATATTAADRLEADGLADEVLLADGGGFVAATVAGPAAAAADGVVLLTAGSAQAPETAAWLAARPTVPVTAIGAEAAAAAPEATAVTADTPAELSVAVAEAFFTDPAVLGVATAGAFPDPLSGGTHVALLGGALLLSDGDALPAEVAAYLASVAASVTDVYVYGGTAALSDQVAAEIAAALAEQ